MAQIDDLPIPRLSEMSDEELHRTIREVRARRLLRTDPVVRKQSKKPAMAAVPLTEDQLLTLLASNPELAAKLLGGK